MVAVCLGMSFCERGLNSLLGLVVAGSTLACTAQETMTCEEAHDLMVECFGEEQGSLYQCSDASLADLEGLSCSDIATMQERSDGCLFGIGCRQADLFADPEGSPTRYPIVLAHGFNGSPTNNWGWHKDLIAALRADGHDVHIAAVPPFQGVGVRAEEHLAPFVDEVLGMTGADKVNIIAHSMGGLDSRYLVSSLGYHDRVASVVTISSPHRGSAVADDALSIINLFGDKAVGKLNDMATAFGKTFTTEDLAEGSDLREALESLSVANSARFNEANPDHPEVYYQSWAGVSHAFRIGNGNGDRKACEDDAGGVLYTHGPNDFKRLDLVAMAISVGKFGTVPNDGMATVESAVWGDFIGCVPADHYDEVGQVDKPGLRTSTGFNPTSFLRTIAYHLSARGY